MSNTTKMVQDRATRTIADQTDLTDRKSYMIYRMLPFSVTLTDP